VTVTDASPARPDADDALRAAVLDLCRPGRIVSVVQPIVRPADMAVVGYEALARMQGEPPRPPDWWLAAAAGLGLRHELEVACFVAAAALGSPPEGRALFVNASPSTITDPAVLELREMLPERLVVELTEQEAVEDYDRLRRFLGRWLARGTRLAVDDAGAGYSSLRHVVDLSPDYLKLDRELVRGVHEDPNRRALLRAVVAFAREVGTSVIAEGVETAGELEVLRDAEVHLVQGYLLARPAPPWPQLSRTRPASGGAAPAGAAGDDRVLATGTRADLRRERLRRSLGRVDNVLEACEVAVEDLFRHEHLMSSLYLERGHELRCVAHRGLWQVLDGLPGSAGITGRTWATGRTIVVEDVSTDPDYREAIPGVVAEICVPVEVAGETVGALNAESTRPLAGGVVGEVEAVARLLAERLEVIGTNLGNTRWHRAALASTALSGLEAGRRLPQQVLHRLCDAAEMDSACLLVDEPAAAPVVAAAGPLAGSFLALTDDEVASLSGLVGDIRSCYTAGDASGMGFMGTESLRLAGARAVVVLPLWVRRRRFGTLVLAHSRPIGLSGDRVEPLELLADHAAAVLAPSVSVVGEGSAPGRSGF